MFYTIWIIINRGYYLKMDEGNATFYINPANVDFLDAPELKENNDFYNVEIVDYH